MELIISVSGWLCYANAKSGNIGGTYTLSQLGHFCLISRITGTSLILFRLVRVRFKFGLWLTN